MASTDFVVIINISFTAVSGRITYTVKVYRPQVSFATVGFWITSTVLIGVISVFLAAINCGVTDTCLILTPVCVWAAVSMLTATRPNGWIGILTTFNSWVAWAVITLLPGISWTAEIV